MVVESGETRILLLVEPPGDHVYENGPMAKESTGVILMLLSGHMITAEAVFASGVLPVTVTLQGVGVTMSPVMQEEAQFEPGEVHLAKLSVKAIGAGLQLGVGRHGDKFAVTAQISQLA